MFTHQACEGCAMGAPVMPAQVVRAVAINAQCVHHISRHTHFDLIEKRHMRRIQRMIEVEHPSVHVREMRFHHARDANGNSQVSQQVDQKCCCA